MKRNINIIFILVALIFFVGCSNTDDLEIGESTISISNPTPVPTPDMTGKGINRLTGHHIDYNIANQRPIAVVINNINRALPQSGIKDADLYYEVLAEGDITRIIAVFQDYNHAKVGPIRSARDYFLDFALDNDALFIHHGGSPSAYTSINRLNIDNLDGMNDTVNFFRDRTRLNTAGMYEHSSYINTQNLKQHFIGRGIRTERFEDDITGFNFFPVVASSVGAGRTNEITVPFSNAYISTFKYDEETRLYSKYSSGNPHIDVEVNEQLTVTNVLVQNVNMHLIPGDEAGRRQVDLVGRGDGYLFTNGAYSHVTWSKQSHTSPTKWFDQQGRELRLNKGKTWICIYNGTPLFDDITLIDYE